MSSADEAQLVPLVAMLSNRNVTGSDWLLIAASWPEVSESEVTMRGFWAVSVVYETVGEKFVNVPELPTWYWNCTVAAVPVLLGVKSWKLNESNCQPVVSLKVRVMEPSRLDGSPARHPSARSVPVARPADHVWLAPGTLRKYVVVVALALFATCAVFHVNAVPFDVAVEDVHTPQPAGRAVPSELKSCV